MLNARNQMGNPRARIIGISKDGGQHWDSVYIDNQLPDPVCEGTILTVGIKNKKSILAFCNTADTQQRNKLTLRLSDSEGATWNKFWTIDSTQDKKSDYTAYCDIAMLKKNKLGILFEKDNYKKIVFTQINLKKNFSNK
jgi:sialidase-1